MQKLHHIKSKAFTLSEALVTISLIGVLAITMISLNNLSSNDYKLAQLKMTQTVQGIHGWGKSLAYSNETGLGAVYAIHDQESLVNSLTDYLKANQTNKIEVVSSFKDAKGETHDDYDNIKLNNGVVIKVDYNLTGKDTIKNGGKTYTINKYKSALATIKVDIPVNGKNEVITEEFDLIGSGKIQPSSKRYPTKS